MSSPKGGGRSGGGGPTPLVANVFATLFENWFEGIVEVLKKNGVDVTLIGLFPKAIRDKIIELMGNNAMTFKMIESATEFIIRSANISDAIRDSLIAIVNEWFRAARELSTHERNIDVVNARLDDVDGRLRAKLIQDINKELKLKDRLKHKDVTSAERVMLRTWVASLQASEHRLFGTWIKLADKLDVEELKALISKLPTANSKKLLDEFGALHATAPTLTSQIRGVAVDLIQGESNELTDAATKFLGDIKSNRDADNVVEDGKSDQLAKDQGVGGEPKTWPSLVVLAVFVVFVLWAFNYWVTLIVIVSVVVALGITIIVLKRTGRFDAAKSWLLATWQSIFN